MEDFDNIDIVQAALSGDPIETERMFNDRLNTEISDRIEIMRADIAQQILTTQEPTDEIDS